MKQLKCIDCQQTITTTGFHRKRCGSIKDKSGCAYKALLKDTKRNKGKYRKKRKFRETESLYYKEWYAKNGRKRNPLTVQAHTAVRLAIRQSLLIRPDICQHCGNKTKIQAHHSDYSKPLQVIWLCPPCHKTEHHHIALEQLRR